ncbi:hypothetical protein [Nocardia caishijiensis]|uniref:Uncharacterized protein n=1 Tax=Nocardia caishijiensis TaxID=184756 RepID=A0ABQ6YID2_9NOCA|nr:hypothetical protein [Nocardia caishijiensis]KAF0845291.1 hypothetical protein FNL39_10899 [Nocardia caishijiensis]
MSVVVPVGWAIVAKPAGTKSDYSVRAASREPCSDAVIRELVLARGPGNPPQGRERGASGLPWVWFMQAEIRGRHYIYVVVREWTELTDGTSRPIATNRLVCVDLDAFLTSGCGFADLYTVVSELELPVDPDRPGAGDPASLELSASTPALEGVTGWGAVADAAAALLETSVTLVNGPTALVDRLAVFDAIAALLPGGARSWLSASSWADAAVSRLPKLIFAQRGRGGDTVIDLANPRPTLLSSSSAAYRELLDTLCAKHTRPVVLDHLGRQVAVRDRDPAQVMMALADLDLASVVADKAERGQVDVAEVRRLGLQDRFGDLTDEQLRRVVQYYLVVARADDLHRDRALIGKYLYFDQDGFADALYRLLEEQPSPQTVRELAEVTQTVDLARMFVEALQRAYNTDRALFDQVELAETVLTLTEQDYWTVALAPLVAGIPGLARVAARRVFFTSGTRGPWVAHVAAAAGAQSPWTTLSSALDGALGAVSPAVIDELWQFDPDLVRELLVRASVNEPERVEDLLDGILPVLRHHIAEPMPPALVSQLADMVVADPNRQADIDFVLYSKHSRPKSGFNEPDDAYRARLIDLIDSTSMPQQDRTRLITAIADRLTPYWSGQHPKSTLDGLWRLTHPAGAAETALAAVLRAIGIEDTTTNGRLSHSPYLGRWHHELRVDTSTTSASASARIRSLTHSASVPEVATAIAQAGQSGLRPADIVALLRATSWRGRTASSWFQLANRVTMELVERGAAQPAEPGAALIHAWAEGEFGVRTDAEVQTFGRYVKAQTELSKRMSDSLGSNSSRWGVRSVASALGRGMGGRKQQGERNDTIER